MFINTTALEATVHIYLYARSPDLSLSVAYVVGPFSISTKTLSMTEYEDYAEIVTEPKIRNCNIIHVNFIKINPLAGVCFASSPHRRWSEINFISGTTNELDNNPLI